MCHNFCTQTGCKLAGRCAFLHPEAECQPNEGTKKGGGKSQALRVVHLRTACRQQLHPYCGRAEILLKPSCVFGSVETRFHLSTFGKEKGPFFGVIQTTHLHGRNLHDPKFADQTHEETFAKERYRAAEQHREVAKNEYKY